MGEGQVVYMFARADVQKASVITNYLNAWAKEGWTVVSHTEAGGEYSFVFMRYE